MSGVSILTDRSVLPDVEGVNTDRTTKSLYDHFRSGHYTLVWWHPQALSPVACKTCGGIAEPVQLLEAIYEAGCSVVGLSYEKPERLAKYLYDIGMEYPMLSVDRQAARAHGVAKAEGEQWQGIPRRMAFLVDEHAQVINRYEVNDAVAFLRTVLGDVKAGPPPSKWTPVKKRKKFLGFL